MENNPIGSMMVTLKSIDGELFDVPVAVAMQCKTISDLIEDGWDRKPIPLYNVSAKTLKMVINYCTQHVEVADECETDAAWQGTDITWASSRISEEELTIWDGQFVDVDMDTLYDLMAAAKYLEIGGLLKLTTRKVVDLVKGKTVEEMRQIFEIKNDFTAAEEERMHSEFPWALK